MLAVRVSPSVLKKSFTSCQGTRGKHRPMESCWPSSRPCNHPVMTTGGRVPSASWALLSSMSRVKTRVQPGAPPGGLGRTQHRWDFHVIKLVRDENSRTFQSVQTCKCRGFIFFISKNVFNFKLQFFARYLSSVKIYTILYKLWIYWFTGKTSLMDLRYYMRSVLIFIEM